MEVEMALPDFVNCQHCDMRGTCRNGLGGKSCGRCVAKWKNETTGYAGQENEQVGLVCSVCWGRGLTEPAALKWDKRFPFVLASGLVLLGFSVLLLGHFVELPPDKALPFVGTLLGSITGYYFGAEKAGR